jgi:hypothetical protein
MFTSSPVGEGEGEGEAEPEAGTGVEAEAEVEAAAGAEGVGAGGEAEEEPLSEPMVWYVMPSTQSTGRGWEMLPIGGGGVAMKVGELSLLSDLVPRVHPVSNSSTPPVTPVA